jgi:hypothetical protein
MVSDANFVKVVCVAGESDVVNQKWSFPFPFVGLDDKGLNCGWEKQTTD